MHLRTDKASGTITCAFGIAMVVFASLGLMVVALQRMMLATMPPMPQTPDAPPVIDMMHAMHGVWFVYFPITIVGGVVYAVAGFHVRRGSLVARRVAQANALVGYAWIVAYCISCYRIFDSFHPSFLPESASAAVRWISLIGNALMAATLPTALLFILSRPRDQAARTSPEPAEQA